MSAPVPGRRPRWVWFAIGAGIAVLAGLLVVVGGGLHNLGGGAVPTFPSLATHPDRSLHGTVAYYANDSGCIRLVAASGQPSKTLWCIPSSDVSSWEKLGKPAGPQLVWRRDGRLEVTMFRYRPGPGKGQALSAGWQKLIDVKTGRVTNVPAAQVPSAPTSAWGPAVSPGGARVGYSFDASTGRAKVTLADSTGSRTLLSVHGPGEYTYQFGPVFWAPSWQWIAASEDGGRILVITPGPPPATRVLVTNAGGGAGGGPAGPSFAVTGADLLPAG